MNKNTKKISLTILAVILAIALIFLAVNNLFGKTNIKSNAGDEASKNTSIPTPKIAEGEAASLLKILPSDIVIGDKNAPVTIIEYASLSCPHCAVFYSDGFSKLKTEYIATGKVKFAYRDFPLNQPALVAGMLAICQVNDRELDAAKYYDFIKVLFRTQEAWAFGEDFTAKLETLAKLDGMSSEKFNQCIKNKTLQEAVLKARLQATQLLQISSTPTFFINGEIISGYGGYNEIKNVIDKKLGDNSTAPVKSN
ncbi:MAG: DsbA family protein [Pseudomonadota bacterium]